MIPRVKLKNSKKKKNCKIKSKDRQRYIRKSNKQKSNCDTITFKQNRVKI